MDSKEAEPSPGLDGALERVRRDFAEAGRPLRRPLRVAPGNVGVAAFTETQVGMHVMHLERGAIGASWLPGLLAREVAHAVRSDEGHPSHDPALLQRSFEMARERSRDLRFLGRVATLNHHLRDVYADDLADLLLSADLREFLLHVAERAATESDPSDAAVGAGYAAGTLARRGMPAPSGLAPVLEFPGARRLADAFAGLHPEPEEADLVRDLARLVALVPLG